MDDKTGTMPADIGLANHKGLHSMLVEQAWSISPANLQAQSATSDLPTAGYGRGASSRIDTADAGSATGPLPSFEMTVSKPARSVEGMTLKSVLGGLNRQSPNESTISASSASPASRAIEQTGWASSSSFQTDYQPRVSFQPPEAKVAAPAPAPMFTTKFEMPPAVVTKAEVAEPALKSNQFDVKAHPLFANIKEGTARAGDNFNARMEKTAATNSDLARLINPAASSKAADPFMADNCYQSMEISPDGKVTTTTTLQDLSASKIESRFPDKSSTVAFTDHLGRPTIENRFDANGQLVSQTTTHFGNTESPMLPSHKMVKTASQTIETTMDATGKVIASKVMPYSDLNTATANA